MDLFNTPDYLSMILNQLTYRELYEVLAVNKFWHCTTQQILQNYHKITPILQIHHNKKLKNTLITWLQTILREIIITYFCIDNQQPNDNNIFRFIYKIRHDLFEIYLPFHENLIYLNYISKYIWCYVNNNNGIFDHLSKYYNTNITFVNYI